MKNTKEVKTQLNRIEKLCSLYRDCLLERQHNSGRNSIRLEDNIKEGNKLGVNIPNDIIDLEFEHTQLTEQLAVLRWVYTDLDWDDDGLRDT